MNNSDEFQSKSFDHLKEAAEANFEHKSDLLDEGLDKSFPASDPTAVSITRIIKRVSVKVSKSSIKKQ